MENIDNIIDFPDKDNWVLQFNLQVSLMLLFLTIVLVLFIVYLRILKNIRQNIKDTQENLLVSFINSYLFDEDFNVEYEISQFKSTHLKTRLERKVTIRELIIYNENLKGESTTSINKLFIDLGLDKILYNDIRSFLWHRRARAIYVLSKLGIKVPNEVMYKLLNDRIAEVRQQALLYFIKNAQDNPLDFLDNLHEPLTTWQQIYIHDALKYFYEGPIPDFSRWLEHDQSTVVLFSIKMMAEYNQFENISKLVPYLEYEDKEIKREAIKSLTKLGYNDAIEIVVPNFGKESKDVKKEIFEIIKQLGTYRQLQLLSPLVANDEGEIQLEYIKAEQYFLKH